MLQVPQRALDAAEDSLHRAACVTHVISLFITGLALSQIGLELEELVQPKAWISVDGVFGRRVGSIGVDGLVGAAPYDEDWTLLVR